MRKLLTALVITVLMISSLVGCGNTENKVKETSEVVVEKIDEKSDEAANKEVETEKSEETEESKELTLEEQFLASIDFENAEDKGVCGANLYWMYKDEVLLIRGTGDMTDYDVSSPAPWKTLLSNKVAKIIVEEGCTSIGSYAFSTGMDNVVVTISLPDTILEIGEKAFTDIDNVTELKIPENVKLIDANAFSGMGLTGTLVLPDSLERISYNAIPDGLESVEMSSNTVICKESTEVNSFHVINGQGWNVDIKIIYR